jgi:hypothetical protein
MAVVFRNNTSKALIGENVTVSARDAGGQLVGAANSQNHGMYPARITPGHIGFAGVCFDNQLPPDVAFSYNFGPIPGSVSWTGLRVTEATVQPGPTASRMSAVGTIAAPPAPTLTFAWVQIVCFTPDGQVSAEGGEQPEGGVPAGGTAPFSADVYGGTCPIFLASASGFAT